MQALRFQRWFVASIAYAPNNNWQRYPLQAPAVATTWLIQALGDATQHDHAHASTQNGYSQWDMVVMDRNNTIVNKGIAWLHHHYISLWSYDFCILITYTLSTAFQNSLMDICTNSRSCRARPNNTVVCCGQSEFYLSDNFRYFCWSVLRKFLLHQYPLVLFGGDFQRIGALRHHDHFLSLLTSWKQSLRREREVGIALTQVLQATL